MPCFRMAYAFIDSATPRYMGGRRNLVDPLCQTIVEHILLKDNDVQQRFLNGKARALDMCSGSAILSRAMRYLGWEVHAQDSEAYAYNWAAYVVQTNAVVLTQELKKFQDIWGHSWENADKIYARYTQTFLQNYYTLTGSGKRNMYHHETATILDQLWSWSHDEKWKTTPLLHAFVKYEIQRLMILHANTNGTLNSCHQPDALANSRRKDTKSTPVLNYPWTIDGPQGTAYQQDAQHIENKCAYDIVVFDPPQTIHQYSSCYHLLNAYANNNTTIPLGMEEGGTKSGINHTPLSSNWNKPARHNICLDQWVRKWSQKTRWIVVIQPKNSFCTLAEYQRVLSCNSTYHVDTVIYDQAALHVICTYKKNSRMRRKVVDQRKTKLNDIYYVDPERLPLGINIEEHPHGWYIMKEKKLLARLGYSLRVQWASDYEPTKQELNEWQKYTLTTQNRFLWLLRHKYWASALNCLVAHKKELRHNFLTYWSMLHHLVIAHGAHPTLHRMKRFSPKNI